MNREALSREIAGIFREIQVGSHVLSLDKTDEDDKSVTVSLRTIEEELLSVVISERGFSVSTDC